MGLSLSLSLSLSEARSLSLVYNRWKLIAFRDWYACRRASAKFIPPHVEVRNNTNNFL